MKKNHGGKRTGRIRGSRRSAARWAARRPHRDACHPGHFAGSAGSTACRPPTSPTCPPRARPRRRTEPCIFTAPPPPRSQAENSVSPNSCCCKELRGASDPQSQVVSNMLGDGSGARSSKTRRRNGVTSVGNGPSSRLESAHGRYREGRTDSVVSIDPGLVCQSL
jgi:hypothetical protein